MEQGGSEEIDAGAVGGDDVGQEQHLAGLMRAAQAGDRRAYSELLHVLASLVRETVRQRFPVLQSQEIEDLVQNILLSLHAARATYDPTRPFLPWLMAIARNGMVHSARRYARRRPTRRRPNSRMRPFRPHA